jgi:lysine 2,3-aminomutase
VSGTLLQSLQRPRRFRLEIGVHICHPSEFWPEVVDALKALLDANTRVYNQHPLLKGVNDDRDTLFELYDQMRRNGVDAHYLFHAIPMRGMAHHRTSLDKGLALISELSSGGQFSGRAKPHYCAMTDIGKVVLYHGTILRRDAETASVLLRTAYRLKDRLRYNPSWRQSSSVEIGDDGCMNVWYPDGIDDFERPAALTSAAVQPDASATAVLQQRAWIRMRRMPWRRGRACRCSTNQNCCRTNKANLMEAACAPRR